MRSLGLLARGAAAAQAGFGPGGPQALAEACGSSSGTPWRAVSQLTSLLGFQPQHQAQQRAGYAARHRGDEDEDEVAAPAATPGGQHSKLRHSERRRLVERKLQQGALEQEDEAAALSMPAEEYEGWRQGRIKGLLHDMGRGGDDSAAKFVSRCASDLTMGAQSGA
jgi:hypothetical protein